MTQSTVHKPQAGAAADGLSQYLTFVLGSEVFAVAILGIKEIIEYPEITSVPMMPDYFRGVINLRGAVVPVVDLQVRFGRAVSAVSKRTGIVIIEALAGGERQVVGLVVDAVNAVLDIPAGDIEPPPTFGVSVRAEFIHGMAKVDGRFVILLDVDHVLSAQDIQQLDAQETVAA